MSPYRENQYKKDKVEKFISIVSSMPPASWRYSGEKGMWYISIENHKVYIRDGWLIMDYNNFLIRVADSSAYPIIDDIIKNNEEYFKNCAFVELGEKLLKIKKLYY